MISTGGEEGFVKWLDEGTKEGGEGEDQEEEVGGEEGVRRRSGPSM